MEHDHRTRLEPVDDEAGLAVDVAHPQVEDGDRSQGESPPGIPDLAELDGAEPARAGPHEPRFLSGGGEDGGSGPAEVAAERSA